MSAGQPLAQASRGDNIYAIVGAASRALRRSGLPDQIVDAFQRRVDAAQSYDEALRIVEEYVVLEP